MHYGSQPADPLLNIVGVSSSAVMASIGSAGVDSGMSHTRRRHIAMKAPLASDRPDPAQIRRAPLGVSSDPEFLRAEDGIRTRDPHLGKVMRKAHLPADIGADQRFYHSTVCAVLPCFSTSDGRNTDDEALARGLARYSRPLARVERAKPASTPARRTTTPPSKWAPTMVGIIESGSSRPLRGGMQRLFDELPGALPSGRYRTFGDYRVLSRFPSRGTVRSLGWGPIGMRLLNDGVRSCRWFSVSPQPM
jgi:hypothetical protein